jgi:hypothetical protein
VRPQSLFSEKLSMQKISSQASVSFIRKAIPLRSKIGKPIRFALVMAALLGCVGSASAAISVGATGVGPLTFDTQPAAGDWSTLTWAGAAGDVTATNAFETRVQALSAAAINLQLASAAGDPPAASGNAQWSSEGHYLITRPTGTLGHIVMATLVNNSGAEKSTIVLSYRLNVLTPVTEQVLGHLVFFSLTGAAGSWEPIPDLSNQPTDNDEGLYEKKATVNVRSWPNGRTLYLLWADDNGSGSPDTVNEIDDFKIAFAAGAPPRIEILGVGAEFLLGGPLTDPEGDGLDAAGAATSPTWNWAGITSSHEPDFEGAESAFNIFDHKVGGGADKWCCDDPTPGNPVWVAVQFPNPVSITHFTVTSGNDTPTRDPTNWAIQGSNDGLSYTDIYHMTPTTDPVVPWTARNQVVKFTLSVPSAPYRYIRYIAYDTPAPLHQINEIEYFGIKGGSETAFISGIINAVTTFSFRFNDAGASVVDRTTVKLVLDGANITTLGTLTKTTDGKIDVSYKPATQFLPGSVHTYSITAKDSFGNNIGSDGSFTTPNYAFLRTGDKVTPDTSKLGFIFNVHQNNAFQANDNTRPVQQLGGILGTNLADPAAQGVAIAAGKPGANSKLPITFEIDTVLNLSQDGGGAVGNIPDDGQMPGIPGLGETAQTDGIAAEIITFIELPAGPTTMIINSDDGFRTTAGLLTDVFRAQFAGEFVGGRGFADTTFTVYAESAGVYPFRTIWYEGNGGANIEWLTVKADGTKVLVNDTASGGLKAYRVSTTGFPTAVTSVTPTVGNASVDPATAIEAVITEGPTVVDVATVKLTVDGVAVLASVTRNGKVITAKYQPSAGFSAPSSHKATLSFTHGGTARTEEWSFSVPPLTKDKVSGIIGFLTGVAKFSADRGGITGAAGDYAMDLGRGGSSVLVNNLAFFNTAVADDMVTVSIWQSRYDVSAGSVFWFNSPSSSGSTRGFQAHIPWSDNTVYFDTAGCCDGGSQRISSNISNFPTFSGTNTWWNQWRHYVFVKNLTTKQVWIDGVLFFEGDNTSALPTDFTSLVIGGGPGIGDNLDHALLDEMAVYNGALNEADIKRLAAKAAPGTISGLLAHWDFNDAVAVTAPPAATVKLNVVRNGANVSVTSVPAPLPAGWVLQTATSVTGPWTTQTGATTPFSAPISTNRVFLRAIRP